MDTQPEAKKKYLKITAVSLLCMFFLIYSIYHIGNAFREKTELFTVTHETVENTVNLSGYIFRDETVLYGTGVSCIYNYSDGEKIPADSAVAKALFAENAELTESFRSIKSRIAILEQSRSLLHIDIDEIDEEILALRTKIALESAGGNTAFLEKAEKELLVLLHKRKLAEENKKNYETELGVLRAELAAMEAALPGIGRDVVSAQSGYFYSHTDGYENVLTSAEAKNMTVESFERLTSTAPQKSSAAIGKVADIGKWYFACKTTVEACEEIVADKTYFCVFTDNPHAEKMPLLAEKKAVDYAKGEAVIVFSCKYIPSDFDFSRTQRISLVVSEISGLRVPASSVRVENGVTVVHIIKEGVCRTRSINILFEKGGYCVVSAPENGEGLALYDRIIIGEQDLYDGKVIHY